MKLHLCSGRNVKPGFTGVDMQPFEEVEQQVDLNVLPWPWPDNSVSAVFCEDGVEHLAPLGKSQGQLNIVAVMAEIHRILEPGGIVEIIVPSTDGPGAWQDPTHVTFWNRNTFLYFVKGQMPDDIKYDYPEFVLNRRDLAIVDTDPSPPGGIIWTCARLRKPEVEDGGQTGEDDSSDNGGAAGTGSEELQGPAGESGHGEVHSL